MGILRETFRNMVVLLVLTICMTGSIENEKKKKKKRSILITKTRRDQMLSSYTASTVLDVLNKTVFIHHRLQAHTTAVGILHMYQMWYQAGLYRRILHLSMLHFLKIIFSVVNSLCYEKSRTVNFVIVSQYREKGIKLNYKMTYQICLTGTNSL